MLPVQLLATVVPVVFPLVAEIDCRPLAARVGTAYKIDRVVAESVTGKTLDTAGSVGAAANLDDAVDLIFIVFNGTKRIDVRQQGAFVIVDAIDGAPVRKVAFHFADGGPMPTVRYVPRRSSR